MVSCNSNTKTLISQNGKEKLKAFANEKYDDNYLMLFNESKEFSLVINKTKKFSELGFNINYFLFSMSEERILIEDYLITGQVEWIEDYKIKAISRNPISGQTGRREKVIYIFDAKEEYKEYQKPM